MTQRINWIDWAKVFAIYLVILGHHISKDAEGESFVKNFIYAFHMPFFFFISGYLFKEPKSILHLLKKRYKGAYYSLYYIEYIGKHLITTLFYRIETHTLR